MFSVTLFKPILSNDARDYSYRLSQGQGSDGIYSPLKILFAAIFVLPKPELAFVLHVLYACVAKVRTFKVSSHFRTSRVQTIIRNF